MILKIDDMASRTDINPLVALTAAILNGGYLLHLLFDVCSHYA